MGNIRIIHDGDGYPVSIFKLVEVASFRSISEAERSMGVPKTTIKNCVEAGRLHKGMLFLYTDMPVECQPVRPGGKKRRPVVWEGKSYHSIMEAAGGNRTKWMRIFRKIKRTQGMQNEQRN